MIWFKTDLGHYIDLEKIIIIMYLRPEKHVEVDDKILEWKVWFGGNSELYISEKDFLKINDAIFIT